MTDKHVWIDNGKPMGPIVTARTAGEAERFAAEELSRYFEKMSGTALPVREGTSGHDTPSILILDGARPSNRKLLRDCPLDELEHDGYLIKSVGRDLIITSLDPFGIVHGTYQYLVRVLGVRFYDYGSAGEDVPCLETITHEPVSILKNPRLSYRAMQMTYRLARIDWMAKNGFNYARIGADHDLDWWDERLREMAPEFQKRGIRISFGHHDFHMFIPEKLYLEDHPEYFPEANGKRGRRAQFCWNLKNSEVLDEVVHRLERFLSRHPEIETLDFWPSDGLCELDAEDYRAVVGEERPAYEGWQDQVAGASETARMGNPYKADVYAALTCHVAEALAPKFPDCKIVIVAYGDLTQPSTRIRLPENVICTIAMYWRCYRHGLFEEDCVYNDQYRQIVREWREMYPDRDTHLAEYYMGMTAYASLPYPILTTLFEEWPRLLEMGVTGAKVHTGRDADFTTVPYNINYLAFQSIAWDDARSADEFLETYCRGFFGDAWEEMVAMYQAWEERCRRAPHTQPSIHFFHWLFDEDTCRRSQELIERARTKADDPKTQYRLFRLSLLVRYASKALRGSEMLLERTQAARDGRPTEELDRKLLPWVREMDQHVRRLIELGQDIYGHVAETDFMRRGELKTKHSRWERELATLLDADRVSKNTDPDILRAAEGEPSRDLAPGNPTQQ